MRPIKIGFVLFSYTFGGSETETAGLILNSDPELIQYTGIAVKMPFPLPENEPPKDGSFPKIYTIAHKDLENDSRVVFLESFQDAVAKICNESDVIITWGITDLQDYLPQGKLPKIIIHSKDSGSWAESFLYPNSLLTRHYVGNSTLATTAFPTPVHPLTTVIYDGFDPQRVKPKISVKEQRNKWGLNLNDKIVGFLGRIEQDKGVDKIVDGVQLLPDDWKAVFIGINPNSRYAKELQEHCENKIPNRYKLLSWTHDVGSALTAFDVFAHPSEHEGFCNSLAEAWLAGVPTIYTENTGSIPDLGEMGIAVLQNVSAEGMAAAIQQAYCNPIVQKAQKVIANKFVIKNYVTNWTNYIQKVYNENKPRIMMIMPNLVIGGTTTWLLSLLKHAKHVDFCCALIVGDDVHANYKLLKKVVYKYKCPISHAKNHDEVLKEIKNIRPDMVISWGVKDLPKMDIPFIVVSHGSGIDGGVAAWSKNILIKSADHKVAVAKAAATAFDSDDVEIIYNGVEIPTEQQLDRKTARNKLKLKDDEIAVGYVARASREKNPLLLLQSLQYLPSNYRIVYIAGKGDKNLLSVIKKSKRIILCLDVLPHQVYNLLAGLDAVVNLSDGEGFGLSLVEAWAFKKPLISTNVGILQEHPLATLIPFDITPKDLAKVIKKVIKKPDTKMIEQAYDLMLSKFNAIKMVENWSNFCIAKN